MCLAIIVLIFITGNMVVAGIYNIYILLLPILDSVCFQYVPQLVVILHFVEWSDLHSWTIWLFIVLPGLGHCNCSLTLITECGNIRGLLKASPVFQLYISFVLLWISSPFSTW
jgi:hypothetical protein